MGGALAHLYEFPVKYNNPGQHPDQWDTTVFSDPVVPACCASPYIHRPRKWLAQGCGADLHNVFDYFAVTRGPELTPAVYNNNADMMWKHRNYHFFMGPIPAGGYIQTKKETMKYVNQGKIAVANPGGWIEIVVWQVNDDGAGPYRCRIDEGGDGTNFGPWVQVTKQPPGTQAGHSVYGYGNNKRHLLRVQLPGNIKCGAKYGSYANICMLRCENYAVNGPFGGCVPFQVKYPTPPPKPPQQVYVPDTYERKPTYGDAGYDTGDNNYQEGGYKERRKREERRMLARRHHHETGVEEAEEDDKPEETEDTSENGDENVDGDNENNDDEEKI
ncbi:hypothetical protein H072_11057 [Dactylellina haptotyla CBS 200.50]|uniref:Uncharacterized protein n=1 Tax=Dactylellina haptotyla (strain CBS 200.50) TaxID=1284197 RepID=S7ZYJ8_DACHA|nr:hypothetical protein H072_11057 [Dactylellina haptotyla CBS 200.50]